MCLYCCYEITDQHTTTKISRQQQGMLSFLNLKTNLGKIETVNFLI